MLRCAVCLLFTSVSVLNCQFAACDETVKTTQARSRPRLRDFGVAIGVLPTGPSNSLTDVNGVQVGQSDRWRMQ